MKDLSFEPLIAPSLWLGLALIAAGMLVWYALRRPGGTPRKHWSVMVGFMSAAVGVVLFLLLNPTWSHQIEPPGGKPVITLLVDASKSMATPDASGGISRYAAASQVATDLVKSLSDEFEVRVEQFDKSARAIDYADLATITPTGPSTDLATAIGSAIDQERSQGQSVVLLSDGIHNAGGGAARVLQAARVARSLACPIYTRTFGGDVRSNEVAIELHSPQDLAIVGQKLPLTATVTHRGIASGRTIVTLLQDGKTVDQRDVLLDSSGASDAHFLITQDKVGIYPYELRVQPLPAQASLANTTVSYVLRVVDEPIRVLLLEGKPYWDSKFLIRTLSSDPAMALDAITRISDGRLIRRAISHTHSGDAPSTITDTWKILADPKEPLSSADKLRGYQIVVLGRDIDAFLDDAAISNLQTWIAQQGGSLVCYRGSPTEQPDPRLDKLLPVQWTSVTPTRFRMAMTAQGRDLNWLQSDGLADDPLSRLPTLAAEDAVAFSKPLAVVLATSTQADGAPAPAVVYHPYGTGRVVTVEGAGMWRWAFLPPQYQQQEQIYSSLWQSMMRWLTSGANLKPGQICSLRADRIRFSSDEPATATLLVRDDKDQTKVPAVELRLTDAEVANTHSGTATSYVPAPMGSQTGVFRVNFGLLLPGRYLAQVSGAKPDDPASRIIFDVRQVDQEETDLQARPDLMQRIASDSGGAVLSASNPVSDLESHFKSELARTHPPQFEFSSAWDRWWLLVAALGLWGASWGGRRWGGLI